MRPVVLATMIAAACATTAPALAQEGKPESTLAPFSPRDFIACDGYIMPSEGRDGIDQEHESTGWFGLGGQVNNNRLVGTTASRFTQGGVEACDRVLAATDVLPESYHLRRANLLQSRGLHRIVSGETDLGLADLEQVDMLAALSSEPRLPRSLGVSNRLYRAQALMGAGRRDEAEALLAQAQAVRPYSSRMAIAIVNMRYGLDGNLFEYQNRLTDVARFHPELRGQLFATAMSNRDWEGVIAVHRQMDYHPPERTDGGYEIAGFPDIVRQQFEREALGDVVSALALTFLNRDQEAADVLLQLRARVDATKLELPRQANGRRPPREARRVHEYRQSVLPQVERMIEEARGHIGMILAARSGDSDAFLAGVEQTGLSDDVIGLTMLQMLEQNMTDDAERAEVRAAIGVLNQRVAAQTPIIKPPTMDEIYDAMPGPETAANQPTFRRPRNMVSLINPDPAPLQPETQLTQISFTETYATSAAVEEIALLRAAQVALERQQTHFVVVNRTLSRRTLNTSYGYGSVSRQDMGFSVEMRVLTFGPEGPPADYAAMAPLAIDAAAIVAELVPVYIDRPE